eukprot:CAMPEP_0198496028 /NCGR_PEP_ID=MMETSP1462-20131121/5574_1 /TAXON_ID=1333877 /ORGANISM="Brandtodinium nutriculum, Strain RCC3387" /LENGTH=73 /DNA_ID=CAMNT_0044224837 /DNA_START=38 /DNA_END=256 /DNA_ORIENTATION=+
MYARGWLCCRAPTCRRRGPRSLRSGAPGSGGVRPMLCGLGRPPAHGPSPPPGRAVGPERLRARACQAKVAGEN